MKAPITVEIRVQIKRSVFPIGPSSINHRSMSFSSPIANLAKPLTLPCFAKKLFLHSLCSSSVFALHSGHRPDLVGPSFLHNPQRSGCSVRHMSLYIPFTSLCTNFKEELGINYEKGASSPTLFAPTGKRIPERTTAPPSPLCASFGGSAC